MSSTDEGSHAALNRYKTCAVSMSDTGKQQFTANQSIYQLSDKDRSVPDDIDRVLGNAESGVFLRQLLVLYAYFSCWGF